MKVSYLLPVLAGLSSAFLIPPKVSDDIAEAFSTVSNALTEKIHGNPHRQNVKLYCKDCPYYLGAGPSRMKGYDMDTKNSLVFDIEVNTKEAHSISINGLDVFHLGPDSFLQAVQIPGKPDGEDKDAAITGTMPRPMVNLNYEIFVSAVGQNARNIRLHILSVDGFKTHRKMDIIDLTVVADEQGILKIAKVEARHPTKAEASAAFCKTNLLCRWKAYFMDQWLKMKGQKMPQTVDAKPAPPPGRKPGCLGKKPFTPGFKHHDDEHRQQQGDRPHHHHHHEGLIYFLQIIKVVLALCVGIVGGFAVSLIGVTVGHFVIMSYRYATGKEQQKFNWSTLGCGSCTKKVVVLEEEEGLLDEKVMETETEELPAYTDSEGIVRGDEKAEL